jgi:hypothetical protein
MTIDIFVEVQSNNKLWHNCRATWPPHWKRVFEIINFNPTVLYGNSPNYWSTEQLEYVLKRLITFKTTPTYYDYAFDSSKELETIFPSITELVNLFTEYVDNKCIMRIC